MKFNQSGFTLIESLIVLSIFLLIASLSIFLIKPHYLFFEKERFISLFTADILFSQQYAISQQRKLFVYIDPDENYYYVLDNETNKRIIDREIPASVKVIQGTLGKVDIDFFILPDGGTTKFGTFYFKVEQNQYRVVFQIGAGRFYVIKE
jgi:competence protein ComGD